MLYILYYTIHIGILRTVVWHYYYTNLTHRKAYEGATLVLWFCVRAQCEYKHIHVLLMYIYVCTYKTNCIIESDHVNACGCLSLVGNVVWYCDIGGHNFAVLANINVLITIYYNDCDMIHLPVVVFQTMFYRFILLCCQVKITVVNCVQNKLSLSCSVIWNMLPVLYAARAHSGENSRHMLSSLIK